MIRAHDEPAVSLHTPSVSPTRRARAAALALGRNALVPVFAGTVWWKLRDVVYRRQLEDGPLIFLFVAATIVLILATPFVARRLGPPAAAALGPRSRRLAVALLIGLSVWLFGKHLAILPEFLRHDNVPVVDIGGNTWAAAVRLTDRGENPYTHRAQLHSVAGDPHTTVTASGVEMWGVPYYYGYPYFPAMFLSYAPFRWLSPGQHSIRLGNAALLLLAVAGVAWLGHRLASPGRKTLGAGLALLLLGLTQGLGDQLFRFGVTDLLPGVYLLFTFVALTYERRALGGFLLGTTFACKLMPGLVAVPAVLAWLGRRREVQRALVGFAAALAILMLPFVLWHPAGFFSATILFYLTHHAGGDSTSLWYHLPQALQTPFLTVGALLVLGAVTSPLWSSRQDHRALARTVVVAGFTFIAFNKMIHANYHFAIVPLACAVLAADALGAATGSRAADVALSETG